MNKDEKKYFLALNLIEDTSPGTLYSLYGKVKDIRELFDSPRFSKMSGAERNFLKKLKDHQKFYLAQAERELELAGNEKDMEVITIRDSKYPELLRKIFDPPLLLYCKGNLPEGRSISIVGSRDSSRDGNQVALRLARELAGNGFTIVSGMALGIDTCAHKGAIEASGQTIAVLGSGLHWIYPDENKELYHSISRHGAVISEFPLGQKPERYNFPRRNRIISGLSAGTVVVEAGSRSGALITASYALEQGREVFAVPGPVTSRMSEGTNRLIKDGARLIQNVNDILEEFHLPAVSVQAVASRKPPSSEKKDVLNTEEKVILKHIDVEPVGVDEIYYKTKIRINQLEQSLMMLEIKGFIEQVPGHKFRLTE
ncbi:MAG: DNA-processing protein DprA [bacterium]|nr:DNA-processing protein DprA [bacterium]